MRRGDLLARMRAFSERFQIAADPRQPVRQLAVGEQQKVEILKQVLAGARVLILDEPTKVLAPQECDGLFRTIAELRAEGFGIVLITHKLREVLDCADRIAVIRQGRIVDIVDRARASQESLLGLMFEGALAAPPRPAAVAAQHGGADALTLKGVSTPAGAGGTALRDLSINIRPGEIVGIAGVSGNGQRELGELILGLRQPRTRHQVVVGRRRLALVHRDGSREGRRLHSGRSACARLRAGIDGEGKSRARHRRTLSHRYCAGLAEARRRHGAQFCQARLSAP